MYLIPFYEIWQVFIDWGNMIYDSFTSFFYWASQPMVPSGTELHDALEALSWLTMPGLNRLIDQFFPGHFTDTIWDLSLFDLMVPGVVFVVIVTLVKWLLDVFT